MKQTSERTPRRLTACLLAVLLLTAPAAAGCSRSELSELVDHFREEYGPRASSPGTVVDAPPPQFSHTDAEPEPTETAAETEAPLPAPGGGEEPENGTDAPGSREITMKSVSAANKMSLLVSRYGCVVTEQQTPDGLRKAYNYAADTPGGRALVEFVDMRGTPSGCFGHVRTADGTWLYVSAPDYDNASSPVTLTEEEDPSGPSVTGDPFGLFEGGSFRVAERGETETVVHCETADGAARGDFTLDSSSLELIRVSVSHEDGSGTEVAFSYGGERFGADRLSSALTAYYSVDPSELTFTLDDIRAANALSALLPAHGAAGYELKWTDQSGGIKSEKASAYNSGGHRIVVVTETRTDGTVSTRYSCDGLSYPDANGYAWAACGARDDSDSLVSSLIPDGAISSVTESGSSVVLTVRFMRGSSPAAARLIADRKTLLLSACEVDLVGDGDGRRLYTVSFTRGGEKPGEERFSGLGAARKAVYHIEWANAPAEDYAYTIPADWIFRLMFFSDVTFWYDAAHTSSTPARYQVPADGWDYEIWVTGAVKYEGMGNGDADMPGVVPSDLTAADIGKANSISNLLSAGLFSVTHTGPAGTDARSFRRDGSLWVLYEKDAAGTESARYGPVRMTRGDDGVLLCTASYGDVVASADKAAPDDRLYAALTDTLAADTLRELVPAGGYGAETVRTFLARPAGEASDGYASGSHIRFTVRRDAPALVSWQKLVNGTVTEEYRFTYGEDVGAEFMAPWSGTRTAAYHVLDGGAEVAFIRVKIPKSAVFNITMPAGWNWFFSDERLREEVSVWYQVPAGEDDAVLWTDNRDPASRPPEEEIPAETPPDDSYPDGAPADTPPSGPEVPDDAYADEPPYSESEDRYDGWEVWEDPEAPGDDEDEDDWSWFWNPDPGGSVVLGGGD